MLSEELTELQSVYTGLNQIEYGEESTTVSGLLAFEASYKELEIIEDCFDVKVKIPKAYPVSLPIVYSLGDHLNRNYDHINDDGSLCLAVPIELRKAFNRTPSLLGFMDNLVVPFLYGYSHWKKYGKYPFGEADHGYQGIRKYYMEIFQTNKEITVLGGLIRILRYGYRGHHPCPCGSGNIVRKCHRDIVFELAQPNFRHELTMDLYSLLSKDKVM